MQKTVDYLPPEICYRRIIGDDEPRKHARASDSDSISMYKNNIMQTHPTPHAKLYTSPPCYLLCRCIRLAAGVDFGEYAEGLIVVCYNRHCRSASRCCCHVDVDSILVPLLSSADIRSTQGAIIVPVAYLGGWLLIRMRSKGLSTMVRLLSSVIVDGL
jgi:hypothetical protein